MKRFNQKHISVHKGYMRYKRKYCHRLIWEQDVGPIPEGFDIHHKDGNKFNNLLSNLECLSKSDHMKLHALETKDKRAKCMSDNSDKLHAWMHTKKAKAFLSEKAKKEAANRPFKEFTCQHCKNLFQTQSTRPTKYCGDNCVMRARRARKADMEDRVCVICSASFTINRYQLTKTCSFPCRNKLLSQTKLKKSIVT